MSSVRSLISDLIRLAGKQPDKVAILDAEGRDLTYRKLMDHVENAQALLTKLGIKSGDTVVALLPNAIETLIMFLACLRGGLYVCAFTMYSNDNGSASMERIDSITPVFDGQSC